MIQPTRSSGCGRSWQRRYSTSPGICHSTLEASLSAAENSRDSFRSRTRRCRSAIQWDKDDLEALGLLKIDVLALGMLSAIRRTLDIVSEQRGERFEMQDIPSEDSATYEMISQADTVGVFQIESRAQVSMLPRMQPRTFYDLVIEVAIVRPGPIHGGAVHPYLRRRQKIEPVTYPSVALETALGRTLGVPIFQEQVMQVAILAADFTDQLRRAMAAWKRKGGLEKYYDRIVNGMRERGYDQSFAEAIFEQIKGFGEYGFSESHAASFALLVYASSWLKCHEPAAFLAAMLNSQPMGFYSPSQLVQDAKRHGVKVALSMSRSAVGIRSSNGNQMSHSRSSRTLIAERYARWRFGAHRERTRGEAVRERERLGAPRSTRSPRSASAGGRQCVAVAGREQA